jgi:hypothetical protein
MDPEAQTNDCTICLDPVADCDTFLTICSQSCRVKLCEQCLAAAVVHGRCIYCNHTIVYDVQDNKPLLAWLLLALMAYAATIASAKIWGTL